MLSACYIYGLSLFVRTDSFIFHIGGHQFHFDVWLHHTVPAVQVFSVQVTTVVLLPAHRALVFEHPLTLLAVASHCLVHLVSPAAVPAYVGKVCIIPKGLRAGPERVVAICN